MASFAQELEDADSIINKGELIRTGYMEKQGEIVRSFKKRYFKLWSNMIMEYFKDQSNAKTAPKGIIDLSSTLNMTKSDNNKQFEVECPSRIWKFKTMTEFSRDSWFHSIYMVWKGIDHKHDINKKQQGMNKEKQNKPQQYGYNTYNYDINQNIDNGPGLQQSEEGVNHNNNNNNNININDNPWQQNKDSVDLLWSDQPHNELNEGAYKPTKRDIDDKDVKLKQIGLNKDNNDSSHGLISTVPEAPDGFMFHRINAGDSLVSLSVKYGVSQNKIKQYNNDICFGHRLAHILGKLILIPIASNVMLTEHIKKQIAEIYKEDNKYNLDDLDEKEYAEPDENGKYVLRKALIYHAKDLDEFRCDYYLGAAKWNVRKALKLWKTDDIWEKQQKIMKELQLNAEEAVILLENFNWNTDYAIQQRKKNGKKIIKNNNNNHNNNGIQEMTMM